MVQSTGSGGYVIQNNNANEHIGGSFLAIGVDRFNVAYASLNGLNDRITSTVTQSLSTVNQVVVLWNGTHHQMYVDGNLVVSKALVGSINSPDATTSIGSSYWNAAYRPAKGGVYSVRAYNRTLSATEILTNFNSQKGRYGR